MPDRSPSVKSMINKQILQGDYTVSSSCQQIFLPIDMGQIIPPDDKVRLVEAMVNGLDLTELYNSYGRVPKKTVTPRQMFMIVLFAFSKGIYSSRDIEEACKENTRFMYLLAGKQAPDHTTIARFIDIHLSKCPKDVLAEFTTELYELGEISGKTAFIDGTKMEAYANRYTFVWKRAVTTNKAKLANKAELLVERIEATYAVNPECSISGRISLRTLKKLRKELRIKKKNESIEFVHGTGRRKTQLQKDIEELEKIIDKLKDYIYKEYICGDERNSYSKTDHDATFMRMKDDYMRNGQLKPGYNIQHAVDSEYIVWVSSFCKATDTVTLIPFLKEMKDKLPFKYKEIIADAGYESEENYVYLEEEEQIAYIKPTNYEISKKRSYKTDISRRENMEYNKESDCYICKAGKELKAKGTHKRRSKTGYESSVTVYECSDCKGCPLKGRCIKGRNCKTPIEDRCKRIEVSKLMQEHRDKDLERILSDYGCKLRMNRSIQVEGSFSNIKEAMGVRRFWHRGNENILTVSILLALANNINKLHQKIQNNRTGTHLFELKKVS